MDKITFIIPAHNCAETIERTVESIQSTQLGTEVIIVENGSVDNTVDAIKGLTKKYSNIRFLTSEKGVSKARNKGIDAANGDWIIFVDADDECLDGVKTISEHLSKDDLELIIGSYKKDSDSISHDYKILNKVTENTDELKAWLISKPTLRMQAWAKVYRTAFLKKYNLRFNENLSYSEDSEFVIRVLLKTRRIMIADSLFYQYHSGTDSAMRGFTEGRIEKYVRALNAAEKDIEPENAVVKRAFKEYVIAHINIMGVHDVFGAEIKESWMVRCRKMNELLSVGEINRAIKDLRFPNNLQTLPVALCKYHLTSIGGAIYYVRSFQNRRRYQRAQRNQGTCVNYQSGTSC